MSLIQRRPRPIKREAASLRDDRLFIVACDDTCAPKQYFEFFEIPRVQVHVEPTVDGTSCAQHVLDRLLKYEHEEDDELWLLLDTDHCACGTHLTGFTAAISEAKKRGVKIALSKPCFELWLLYHHLESSEIADLVDAAAVEAKLRVTLGEYNKKRLKVEHFPIEKVPVAFKRAAYLMNVQKTGIRKFSSCRRKPESSAIKQLQFSRTPVFTEVTTFARPSGMT